MDNDRRCACCKNTLEGQFCGYCGFMNIAAFDKTAEQETAAEAREWRKELIGQLSDYGIVSYEYGWKEEVSEFGFISTKINILADGRQCDGSVFWADRQFGQLLENETKPITIRLTYKFNGKENKLNCEIASAVCEDFWRIGLEITEQMRLVVYLGNEHKFAKSEPLAMNLS